MALHPTAQIHPSAQLPDDVEVGAFTLIGSNVIIGHRCKIGHHVVVHDGSVIGDNVRVDDHAVIGKTPMRAKRSETTTFEPLPSAVVGHDSIVGTGAIVYAGCSVGSAVLLADYATLREHVDIGDETIVGRGVAVENDCSIGARCKLETNAYICAYTTIGNDVFVAPGVLTSNDNYLGRTEERKKHFGGPVIESAARVGVGAVILPGKRISSEAVVAAGAVLTRDAEEQRIHQGVPARAGREVPQEQLLSSSSRDQ
ncbi:MAG: acyltransferase [Rubricoccaceae bacterium]|nr:acyltransferase [Rubricoccaceae bacterium]